MYTEPMRVPFINTEKNLENIVGFGLLIYALYRWKAIEESE